MNESIEILVRSLVSELPVLLIALLAFVALPLISGRKLANLLLPAERIFSRFALHKSFCIFLLFLTVVAVRLVVLRQLPVPVPGIHDEFSYLLQADTFAHGRLANPTHPMWKSFETFHVNWFPTYSSKYPPAQGAVLALGQVLGHPWIGVLLSDALMCAAILWMLQAWLPPRWALLGGTLVAVKFGVASYWMNSYWGGAVAGIGGALVLGALPRVFCKVQKRDSLLLGLGLAILANARPYEGLLFCIPAFGWFFWWLAGNSNSAHVARDRFFKGFLPAAAALVLTIAFMGYYNWRLTGNALLFPHTLNSRTYRTMGLFLWDHPKPPLQYDNDQFEDFYNIWEREDYDNSWRGILNVSAEKLVRVGSTYFWWGAALLLPGLVFVFRERKMRLPFLSFCLVIAGFFSLIWSMPHYVAPLTCVVYLFLVQAIRYTCSFYISGRPIGIALSWAVVCLLAVDVGLSLHNRECDPLHWTCQGDPSRAVIAEKLARTPGKHLIMVRYSEDHNIHDEWVYNGAEIDSAKVLWARELNENQNSKLFAYFRNRQVWLVTPDEDNTRLVSYAPPSSPADPR